MSKASKRVGDDSFDGMADENSGDPTPKVKPPKVEKKVVIGTSLGDLLKTHLEGGKRC